MEPLDPRLGPARGMLVALATLGARLAILLHVEAADPFFREPRADSILYLERAARIAAGDPWNGAVFEQGPLYPYLLAPLLPLSSDPILLVAIVQCVLESGTSLATAALACRLARSQAAGLAAGLCYAAAREPAFYATKVLPVAPTLLLLTLSVLAASGRRRLIGGGACGGLACLLWPGALPSIVLLGAWAAWAGLGWRGPLRFATGAVLAIAPATAHNLRYESWPVLISSHGGITLYQGNNERARGTYTSAGSGADIRQQEASSHRLAERIAGRPLESSEASRVLGGEARRYILANPGAALRLLGRKAGLAFSGVETPLMYSIAFERRRFVPELGWLPVSFGTLAALVPAALALAGGPTRRRLLPTFAAAAGLLATLLLVFVTTRYKMPLFPLCCAWLGAGVAGASRAGRRSLTFAALLALPGAFLGWRERGRDPVPLSLYTHLSDIRAREGDLPAALLELELALTHRPGFPPATARRDGLAALASRVPVALLLGPLAAPDGPPPGEAAAVAALLDARGERQMARRMARLALATSEGDATTRRIALAALQGSAPVDPPASGRAAP